jgi:GNAT superfamily N-acetyltransferase
MDVSCLVEDRVVRALVDGSQVGRISVPDIDFHWGEGVFVSMAGIAGVGTDEEFRRRGIASKMMEEATAFARSKGYSCSGVSTNLSNNARRLYAKAGYIMLFKPGQFEKTITSSEATEESGVRIRRYETGDESELIGIFETVYRSHYGHRKKTQARWKILRDKIRTEDPDFIFVAERNDEIVGWSGYFQQWFGPVSEICVLPGEDFEVIARALLGRLETHLFEGGKADLGMWVPDDGGPIATLLAQSGYRFNEMRVFMLSILDLPGLLKALLPLFNKRIDGQESWQGGLVIRTPSQQSGLNVGEALRVYDGSAPDAEILLPQDVLVKMLSGLMPAREAYLDGLLDVQPRMTPDLGALLNTLFPQVPMFHPADDLW